MTFTTLYVDMVQAKRHTQEPCVSISDRRENELRKRMKAAVVPHASVSNWKFLAKGAYGSCFVDPDNEHIIKVQGRVKWSDGFDAVSLNEAEFYLIDRAGPANTTAGFSEVIGVLAPVTELYGDSKEEPDILEAPLCIIMKRAGTRLADSMFTYSTKTTLEIMLQLCSIMQQLQAMNISHGDVCPANILVCPDASPFADEDTCPIVTLIDMGMIQRHKEGYFFNTKMPIRTTAPWRAPECIPGPDGSNPSYNGMCDAWSVGIIFISMLNRAHITLGLLSPVDSLPREKVVSRYAALEHFVAVDAKGESILTRKLLDKNRTREANLKVYMQACELALAMIDFKPYVRPDWGVVISQLLMLRESY